MNVKCAQTELSIDTSANNFCYYFGSWDYLYIAKAEVQN